MYMFIMLVFQSIPILCLLVYGVSFSNSLNYEHMSQTTTDVISQLTQRIEGMEKKLAQQEVENMGQTNTIDRLEERLSATTEELNILREKSSTQTRRNERSHAFKDKRQSEIVAFTSYLDHTVAHLQINDRVIYNRVLLNEGGAYNNNTGVFTCPFDGIYAFSFMVSTAGVQQIVAKLVVDGVNQVDAISDTFHDYHEAQGGNHVILSLTKGQLVWVSNYRWSDKGVSSTVANRFATFSGHFLV